MADLSSRNGNLLPQKSFGTGDEEPGANRAAIVPGKKVVAGSACRVIIEVRTARKQAVHSYGSFFCQALNLWVGGGKRPLAFKTSQIVDIESRLLSTMRRIVDGGPWIFRLAKRLIRSKVRCSYNLLQIIRRAGLLNVVALYSLGERVKFGAPIYRAENRWDLWDVEHYERALIQDFCAALLPLRQVTLFDCGADIGTFCSLVCAHSENIAKIIAIEPNPTVQEMLRYNMAALPVAAEIVSKAVSNFEGRGRLQQPTYDSADHARFLVAGDGPLEVTTIDSLGVRGGDVAIKIDVEGGELEVLKGAAQTITAARECVVAAEAHPDVSKRIQRDPVEYLRFLETLRPFHFVVAETGEKPSMSRPILLDGQTTVWNIVGWTHTGAVAGL